MQYRLWGEMASFWETFSGKRFVCCTLIIADNIFIPRCPWKQVFYILHLCKISWLVQGYTLWKGHRMWLIFTFHWLHLNAYSYSLPQPSLVQLFESRITLLQKVWKLFRCCCTNMSEQRGNGMFGHSSAAAAQTCGINPDESTWIILGG